MCSLWAFQMIPHTTLSGPFYKRASWPSCRRCPLGSNGIHKICNPKKWVVRPKGFPTIPHTTVNRPFFKRHYFSSAEDALWVQRLPLRLVAPKMSCTAKELFNNRLLHTTVHRPFFKRCCFSSAGDALWVQCASLRLVAPRNGLYRPALSNDTPHNIK